MLSKKALSVAVAAVLTQGVANATVDFQGTNGDLELLAKGSGEGRVVATEALWDENSFLLQNKDGTPMHFTSDVLRTVAEGTNKYVRIDLTNAAFESTPVLTFATLAEEETVNNARASGDLYDEIVAFLAEQTSSGDDANVPKPESTVFFIDPAGEFVIFEISAKDVDTDSEINEDIPRWLSFTVENDSYVVNAKNGCVEARYRLYNNPAIAQNNPGDTVETLVDLSVSDALCFAEATVEQFATVNNAYTGLQSEFTKFINADSKYYDTDETSYYDERMNDDTDNGGDNDSGKDGVGTWKGAAVTAETASVGFVNAAEILKPLATDANGVVTEKAKINPNGGDYSVVDIVASGTATASPTITLKSTNANGFAFGTWTLARVTPALDVATGLPVSLTPAQVLAACDDVSADADIANVDMRAHVAPTAGVNDMRVFNVTEDELERDIFTACVNVEDMMSDTEDNLIVGDENPYIKDGVWQRILESGYTATLNWSLPANADFIDGDGWEETYGSSPALIDDNADGELTQALGSIFYDTMTVDVPFLSSFGNYNQRFHLSNFGPTPARYSFEFYTEDGVTVTDGAKKEGVIPANGKIVVQTSDIVGTFTDTVSSRTRASALLHIGAEKQDVAVAVAVINKDKGTIDIQNLTTERDTNELPDANLQN